MNDTVNNENGQDDGQSGADAQPSEGNSEATATETPVSPESGAAAPEATAEVPTPPEEEAETPPAPDADDSPEVSETPDDVTDEAAPEGDAEEAPCGSRNAQISALMEKKMGAKGFYRADQLPEGAFAALHEECAAEVDASTDE